MDSEDEDAFDSDAVDFGLPKPSRFAKAGQLSCQKIMDNAMVDRIDSKRSSKTLTDIRGSPKSQYRRALWMNRLYTFRTETLKVE